MLNTFQINAIGHLLTYKHFVPLLPSKKAFNEIQRKWSDGTPDPAKGLISKDNSVCFSLSARVGSIEDNKKGGWYSYRSYVLPLLAHSKRSLKGQIRSKAALNQFIRSLDHEVPTLLRTRQRIPADM